MWVYLKRTRKHYKYHYLQDKLLLPMLQTWVSFLKKNTTGALVSIQEYTDGIPSYPLSLT